MKFLFIINAVIFFSCEANQSNREENLFEEIQIDGELKIDSTTGKAYDEEGNFVGIVFVPKTNKNLIMTTEGLNNEIFYQLDSGNIKVRAFKYNYHTEDFSVDINNDSIYLGDQFIGYIGFRIENDNRAIIDSDDGQIVIKELEPNRSLGYQVYEHRIEANNVGIKDFKGKLIIDGKDYPFLYKYVVISDPRL